MEHNEKKSLTISAVDDLIRKGDDAGTVWGEYQIKILPSATRKLSYQLDMDIKREDLDTLVEYREILNAFEETESEAFRLVSERFNELLESLVRGDNA